jgi:hypothetical protein
MSKERLVFLNAEIQRLRDSLPHFEEYNGAFDGANAANIEYQHLRWAARSQLASQGLITEETKAALKEAKSVFDSSILVRDQLSTRMKETEEQLKKLEDERAQLIEAIIKEIEQ